MAQGILKTAVVITAILIFGAGVATIFVASISMRSSESKIFVGTAKTAKVIDININYLVRKHLLSP